MARTRNNQYPVAENTSQQSTTFQGSDELIHVIDSTDVTIHSTDTQVAVSLQAALQVAIAVVVNITIADSSRAEEVTQELLQGSRIGQFNNQRVIIEGSQNVNITTTDTDVAASIQVLLQILIALIAEIDVL